MIESTVFNKLLVSPSIKLSKGMNDNYSWEIKLSGENIEEVIERIEKIDKQLRLKYKKTEGEKREK